MASTPEVTPPSAPVGRSSDEEEARFDGNKSPDLKTVAGRAQELVDWMWEGPEGNYRDQCGHVARLLGQYEAEAFAAGSASSVDRVRVRECADKLSALSEKLCDIRLGRESVSAMHVIDCEQAARELESELRRLCDAE